jgi:anti-sigma factor RsiW
VDDFIVSRGTPGSSHDVDGILIRYLDGELSGSEEQEACALLASSPEARRRFEELSLTTQLFSDGMAGLALPGVPELRLPTHPNRMVRHRLAAGIVLLLLSVSLIAPARAWIVEGARSLVSMLNLAADRAPTAPAPGAGPSTVSFVPVGNEFLVSVEVPQTSGQLTVEVVEGSRASGEASGSGPDVELLVLPGGIEVRNEPGSAADYRVAVPQSVATLRVRVGGRELGTRRVEGVEAGHTWTFALAGREG